MRDGGRGGLVDREDLVRVLHSEAGGGLVGHLESCGVLTVGPVGCIVATGCGEQEGRRGGWIERECRSCVCVLQRGLICDNLARKGKCVELSSRQGRIDRDDAIV